jgi:hypothetical protein
MNTSIATFTVSKAHRGMHEFSSSDESLVRNSIMRCSGTSVRSVGFTRLGDDGKKARVLMCTVEFNTPVSEAAVRTTLDRTGLFHIKFDELSVVTPPPMSIHKT